MKKLEYPLFGLIYNYKGMKEENYLYTSKELDRPIVDCFTTMKSASYDNGCGNKTWTMFQIDTEKELRDFLTGKKNGDTSKYDVTEQENADWYWETVLENDFFGRPSDTIRTAVSLLHLSREKLSGYYKKKESLSFEIGLLYDGKYDLKHTSGNTLEEAIANLEGTIDTAKEYTLLNIKAVSGWDSYMLSLVDDAREHCFGYMRDKQYHFFLHDIDYYILAERFFLQHDSNISDNDQWEILVRSYIDHILVSSERRSDEIR